MYSRYSDFSIAHIEELASSLSIDIEELKKLKNPSDFEKASISAKERLLKELRGYLAEKAKDEEEKSQGSS